jgi:hypothetical protein
MLIRYDICSEFIEYQEMEAVQGTDCVNSPGTVKALSNLSVCAHITRVAQGVAGVPLSY